MSRLRFFSLLVVVLLGTLSLLSGWEGASSALAQPSSTSTTPQEPIKGVTTVGEKGVTVRTGDLTTQQNKLDQLGQAALHPARARRQTSRPGQADPASPSISQFPVSSNSGDSQKQALPRAPQTVGLNFLGATLADTGAYPPDTMGTVGPSQFLVILNGRFRSFNKTTGVADGVLNANPDVFFSSVLTPLSGPIVNNFTSDPKVRYDRQTKRWFITMIDVPLDSQGNTSNNRVLLAVSDQASNGVLTNSSTWQLFYFTGDPTNFADYPTLGLDNNALYIGANMFAPNGAFAGTNGYVVRKSSLLSGGPIVETTFTGLIDNTGNGMFTPQGVDNSDPTASTGYFIGTDNNLTGKLDFRRVSDPGGTPTLSNNISLTVPATAYPINVPHKGNTGGATNLLDALDDRLYAATMRNGQIWTAHNIQVDSSGVASNSGGRDGSRWYEIDVTGATPTLTQSGTVFDATAANPRFYWIPSINVSGQGHVAMGFSSAGTNDYVNAATTGRLATDAPGTMRTPPVLYTSSSNAYNATYNRWGDYSYTSVDPDDDMTMWTIQEYVNANNSYGVQVARLLAPPPATPASTNPTAVQTGLPNGQIVISANSVNGSGFFEPGPTFANHLSVSISGGVTVNSITVDSPTQLTLRVSTVGQSAGTRDITVTNPDGQSVTVTGALSLTNICDPLVVSTNDNGTGCGSLRAAVAAANPSNAPSRTISFALSAGSVISLNTGLTINAGVVINNGPCGANSVTIDGTAAPGDGLTLQGVTITNLRVRKFPGRQIVATGHNVLKCVVAGKNIT